MRLFTLRHHRNGPLVKDQFGDVIFYDNKMTAKHHRDRMGGQTVVSFGPDHKLYEGN
jgi:hypothetical protein